MTFKNDQTESSGAVSLPVVKILIIEDNEEHLKGMQEIVEGVQGNRQEFILNTDAVKTKVDAEKILFKEGISYHILIVDIMLEEIDGGMKIIEKLEENNKKDIVVITNALIVSHRFDGKMRQRAHKAGVRAYFVKPVPPKEFRKVLGNIILEVIQKMEE